MKAALIGHPVSQSKSPIIHNYWLKYHDIEGVYDLIEASESDLEHVIRKLLRENYTGFNITVPHKENILGFCDELDDTARRIGAVNTVHIKNKKILGYNTDAYGYMENLKSNAPDFNVKGKTILVLGAGGAARAAIYGLIKEDVDKIYLSNRTIEKAQKLKKDFGSKIEILSWEGRNLKNRKIDLLVNTTSLGMVNKETLHFDLENLKQGAVVNDIVYNPLRTNFLKSAENKGFQVITGIGMLLYQAVPAFELWTGKRPVVTNELQDLILS